MIYLLLGVLTGCLCLLSGRVDCLRDEVDELKKERKCQK